MLFQNTAVTRGTAAMVVTATGMQTQMGQIATMLTSVTRTRSPLQKELGSLTKVLGIIAWTAVAFIFVVGLARGMDASELLLLGTAMAISAIPTGTPGLRLRPAVVRRQAARRLQGRGEEPHRRRDPRRDERDQHRQDRHAHDERDDGLGHLRERRVVQRRGGGLPQDRRDHIGCRAPGPRLHPARVGSGPRQRRHRRRRRQRGRRSDRSRAGRARGQARRRRRRDAPGVPAPGRGAVRLRVQVHGDVPPRDRRGRRAGDRAGEGRTRRRARTLRAIGRTDERVASADRRRAGRHRRGQRAHG